MSLFFLDSRLPDPQISTRRQRCEFLQPLKGCCCVTIFLLSGVAFVVAWMASIPFVASRAEKIGVRKKDIHTLFNLPLIMGVSLLCFAHGANDVANAVGPLAAIVSTFSADQISAKVDIPFWVMLIGAFGLALGLLLFGPKLINTVGDKITKLNAPRAYCVALASAITVLIATTFGLPVSSTHIAIGGIFGVGFLREALESPNKKRLKPGHRINSTSDEAFANIQSRMRRKLVRRRFVLSIAAAWVITVPASAALSAAASCSAAAFASAASFSAAAFASAAASTSAAVYYVAILV